MSSPKNLPFPIGFTNTRTFLQIRSDFPGAVGVGAAIMLIDFAVLQPKHEFFFEDLGFLSRSFDVSRKILEDIVISYDLFKIYENDEDKKVCSPFIIKNLEPYYQAVQAGKIGGEIASKKRKLKQKQQLIELDSKLSEMDSIQGGLEDPISTQVPLNKQTNKQTKEDKNNLSERNFANFKRKIIEKYTNKVVCNSPPYPFKSGVTISLTELGYLHNDFSKKDLRSDDAKKIWLYMFENQEIYKE